MSASTPRSTPSPRSIARPVPHPSLRRAWYIFIGIFTLHNAEEILLNLPKWAASHQALPLTYSWAVFTSLAVALTLIAMGAGFLLEKRQSPRSAPTLVLFSVLMGLNALSHIVLSLINQSFMPGVYTATLLLLPGCSWIVFTLCKK